MRRSAESNGGDAGEEPGMVIVRGISGAVWRDIFVALASVFSALEGL
jgi:hypothetical protein